MARLTVDAAGVVGSAEGPFDVSYTSRDLLLYALGIGATELRYLHEGNPGFCAFPTYPLVLPYKGTSSDVVPFPGRTLFLIPQALRHVVNPGAILHYDQSIDIFGALDPAGAELESRSVVLGAYRRRGGVLLRTKTTLTSKNGGDTLAETTQGTFMRGLEIVGDVGPPLPPRLQPPPGAPDVVATVTVSPHQALLYRLSGDYNAIHVDPEAAKRAGLNAPILHGLCSLGIAARQIVRHFCSGANDCAAASSLGLLSLYCRFSRTVLPGDVLEVKMWGQAAASTGSTKSTSGADDGSRGDESDDVAKTNSANSCVAAARKKVEAGGSVVAVAARLGGNARGVARTEKQRHHQTSPKWPPGSKETIRFEVCSPRQGGAVVVADGRAVVLRGASEQKGRQVCKVEDRVHRARL